MSLKEIVKRTIRFALFPLIAADYFKFNGKKDDRFAISVKDVYPCVKDKTLKTGFDRHYVYHTSWAARKVAAINPEKHVDISSSLFFSGIVSAFVPVEFYDYRPADLSLSNLSSNKADLLDLPFGDGTIKSLSCMHTIEHVGLGRYGDPIDPTADLKAIKELKRVLVHNGDLLFVVPVGKSHIEYNAHRVYSYEQVVEYFSDLKLQEFVLIPEKDGAPIVNATPQRASEENYGCGCFWFKKL